MVFAKKKLKLKTMKKSIFILLINLTAGIMITSCKSDSSTKSDTDDIEPSPAAREQLKEDEMLEDMQAKHIAHNDSVEWEAYKKEAGTKIKANEKLINDLNLEIQKASKKVDKIYQESVNQISKKNTELKVKIDSYTVTTENDWEDFKNELNGELDELGKKIDKVIATKKK